MAASGSTAHVHYTGRLDDGTEFDSSKGRDPLTFVVGSGQVIDGFDRAVAALEPGETATIRLAPEEAYGHHDADLLVSVPKPDGADDLAPGMQVRLTNGATALVTEVDDTTVVLDGNHPLAGEALTFELELVAVE